jgi:hypothetical protein
MKQNTDPKAFDKSLGRYCDLMADGKGAEAALEATGLSHAQADLAWYGDERNPQHVKPNSIKLPEVPSKGDDGFEVQFRRAGLVVAELRAGEHKQHPDQKLSWGQIAVVCGKTESWVRRAFTATGIDSKGTRKGKGGRWLSDEPRFYLGNRKGIGVEDAQPKRLDPNQVAASADKAKTKLPELTSGLRAELGGAVRKATRARKSTARTVAKKVGTSTPEEG